MEISHDAQLLILGAILGGVFSLVAAFVGAHHEDWVKTRRKKRERDESLKYVNEMKSILKDDVVSDVLKIMGTAESTRET